jgi:hypothetical protein
VHPQPAKPLSLRPSGGSLSNASNSIAGTIASPDQHSGDSEARMYVRDQPSMRSNFIQRLNVEAFNSSTHFGLFGSGPGRTSPLLSVGGA